MKKITSLLLSALMIVMAVPVAFAAHEERIDLGNGFYMVVDQQEQSDIDTLSAREDEKTGTVYYSGTKVGTITVTAEFYYNGSTVRVESKSISVTTANGWSYKNSKTSSSGGTATASCTFYKGSQSTSASVSITCDKNGNVS